MNIAEMPVDDKVKAIVAMFEEGSYDYGTCTMGVIAQSLEVCDWGEDGSWLGTKNNIAEALGVSIRLVEAAEAVHDAHRTANRLDKEDIHRESYKVLIDGIIAGSL